MSFFDRVIEVFAWLRIAVAPTLGGALIGVILYFAVGGQLGIVFCALCVALGVVLGVGFAEWARRKHGTLNFISKVNASPDLDKLSRDSNKQDESS